MTTTADVSSLYVTALVTNSGKPDAVVSSLYVNALVSTAGTEQQVSFEQGFGNYQDNQIHLFNKNGSSQFFNGIFFGGIISTEIPNSKQKQSFSTTLAKKIKPQ